MKFVLIGGCPRSGTTLVGSMLGNHPRGQTLPEAPFKVQLALALDATQGDPSSTRAAVLHTILMGHAKFRIWKMPLSEGQLQEALERSATLDSVMCCLGLAFAAHLGVEKDIDFLVDHDPRSIRHATLLRRHLPTSYFLHVVRDGRAVMASFRALDWGPTSPLRAAQYWLTNTSFGLALESMPIPCHRVSYEGLLTHPEQELAAASAHIGVSPTETSPQSDAAFLPSYTADQHSLVGGALDTSRIDRWRETLPQRDIEIFEHQSADMLSYLGYVPVFNRPRKPAASERIRLKIGDLVASRRKRRIKRHRIAEHS